MHQVTHAASQHAPWNKGKLVGQKAPLKLKQIWAIRVRLELADRPRELALFNLAIDSKLRSCDLLKLRVRDVCHGERIAPRAIILQQKTQRPVQFEITEQTASRSRRGSGMPAVDQRTSCFRADSPAHLTYRAGSTPGSSTAG